MTINEKVKAINNKIEQNKAQFDLDRQTAKISALSSGNVGKYKCLTDKDVLFEKRPVTKSCCNQKTNVIKKQTEVINEKEGRRNKLLKKIIGADEKYRDKVSNALLY